MEPNQQVTGVGAYDAWELRQRKPDGRSLRKQRRLEREAMRVRLGQLILRLGTEQCQALLQDVRKRARSLSVQP